MQANYNKPETYGRSWPVSRENAYKNYPRHYARYMFAKKFIAGDVVCDAACGVGYGSHIVAENAELVAGMDIGEDAIQWANKNFPKDNIEFIKADLNGVWPIDKSFDLVISFETLEHLQNPDNFIKEAVNHLKDSGKLIISVPNGPKDFEAHGKKGKHIQFFSEKDLKNLLEPHFKEVKYFSQVYRKNLKHHLKKIIRNKSVRVPENFDFVEGLNKDVKTWLAVAKI